jgi:hypothetical protein
MSFAGAYLEKVSLDPRINSQAPSPALTLVVAIPACNEPDLLRTLDSLRNCSLPKGDVELIIALNSGESAGETVRHQNLLSEAEIVDFSRNHSDERFRILYTHRSGIRDREAGAGYARKLAMDHALSRFNKLDRPDGVILSLDADTTCEGDYLIAVDKHFRSNTESRACSVYFEHPLEGSGFPARVYHGITQYELHLRYYIEGLRYAGHPHAFHTVGSAFCVRAGVYAGQGGMNRRTAGEDFYFLQKIIPLGNYHDLNSTCLIPSPRPSQRVAFGTGPVVGRFLSGGMESLDSYDPRAFCELREFISFIPLLYSRPEGEIMKMYTSWPRSIRQYLGEEFHVRLEEIRRNSARPETFYKRFFRWFNMFRTLKYMNFVNREIYPPVPVQQAAYDFLKRTRPGEEIQTDARELLVYLRKIQRESIWPG